MKNETRSSIAKRFIAFIMMDVAIMFVITYLLSYGQLTWNIFFSNLFIVDLCAILISAILGFGRRVVRRHEILGYDLSVPELKEPPVLIIFSAAITLAGFITLLLSIVIPLIFAG